MKNSIINMRATCVQHANGVIDFLSDKSRFQFFCDSSCIAIYSETSRLRARVPQCEYQRCKDDGDIHIGHENARATLLHLNFMQTRLGFRGFALLAGTAIAGRSLALACSFFGFGSCCLLLLGFFLVLPLLLLLF